LEGRITGLIAMAASVQSMSRLRLLSINNFHYRRAGSDACFLDHDALFRARGWETAVFSMQHASNLPSPWEKHFVEEIEFAREYPALEKVRLASKVIYSREGCVRLECLLQDFSPDVVHVHSLYHHISPSVLPVLARRGVPIVMTAHDYKLACPAYKMFDGRAICEDCRGGRLLPLIRKSCVHGSRAVSALVALETAFHRSRRYYERYVNRIICPSRFLLDKLVEWGWPRERLVYIRNFFDASLWKPNFQAGRYFLYFGRLAPEKGLHALVRASALSKCPTRIVGWGPLRAELIALAERLAAPVEVIDHVCAAQLAPLIQGARAVVVPSEWYENASLALLEGFASGKPAIASDIGGNPELVRDGENGWLFEPGNVRALAALLSGVWNESDENVELHGRCAHVLVSRGHSADRYYGAVTSLYGNLGVRAQCA
jgi:glycosyltransferase involved in cell wall biosynthesis